VLNSALRSSFNNFHSVAAVIAAIGAAFLAGAIALFREHRQQQRRLLVAARVRNATFEVASLSIESSVSTNGWELFNAVPGESSFSAAWEAYKADLAGHLTWRPLYEGPNCT